jgi:hypothetical protein
MKYTPPALSRTLPLLRVLCIHKSQAVDKSRFYPTLTLPDVLGREQDFPVSPQYIGGIKGGNSTCVTHVSVTVASPRVSLRITNYELRIRKLPHCELIHLYASIQKHH